MTRPPEPVRCGLADMGSHAIRFQILQREVDGRWTVLDQRREPVRLGGGLFETGQVPDAAIEAAAAAFAGFRADCNRLGVARIHGIATAATREARNRRRLLAAIERSSGIRVEVISGEREARLLLRAVAHRLDLQTGTTLIADVGGGSVELVLVDQGAAERAASHPYGALWLMARRGPSDPDAPATYRRLLAPLTRAATELLGSRAVDRYAITGGGSASLVALLASNSRTPDGVASLPVPAVAAELERLAGMSLADRARLPQLPADRADTIVAGGSIYLHLAELAGATTVLVPGVGLRDGLLLEVGGEPTVRATPAAPGTGGRGG